MEKCFLDNRRILKATTLTEWPWLIPGITTSDVSDMKPGKDTPPLLKPS